MSLPTWNDYKENNDLPTWDDYQSGKSSSLPTWDQYESGEGASNGSVNLDVIEEIESNHRNDLTSSTGAKGYYQFMPDTSAEYSKRLFGKATRDASTLSHEQQKEMANAYFNDLLKEFNGDADKAIAAYNWGQGNVEKKGIANAPEETKEYLHKYHALENTGYDHSSTSDMTSGEYMKNQLTQIGDLWKGGISEINKATGNEYSQEDIDEAKSELNTNAGKDLRTEAAVAGSVIAPELVPEVEGAGLASWFAKGLAGSEAYQIIDKGTLNAKQTLEDMVAGGIGEGLLRGVAAPAIKRVSGALGKLIESKFANPELTNTVKKYLGAARAEELGKNWKNLRETNPKATLLDAFEHMYKQVPELFDNPEAIEDVKRLTRKFKNTGSHSEFIDSMRGLKQQYTEEAKQLAKSDAEKRLISTIAEANESIRGGVVIPDEIMKSTPLEKVGEKLGDWFGVDTPKAVARSMAAKDLKPEADQLVKDLKADNRRIKRETEKQLARPAGASSTTKLNALTKQRTLNNKMISFIQDGMNGKKVNVNDFAQAIKDVQEEQFNSGKFSGLTKRFQSLSDKMKAAEVMKLNSDKGVTGEIIDHYSKKVVANAAVAYTGGLLSAGKLTVASTVAGKIAKLSKASKLAYAKGLSELVEAGDITEEQAEQMIIERFTGTAQAVGRIAPALSELFSGDSSN